MKKYILPLLILLTSIFLSVYFYPILPDQMASHWNAQGVADGYSSKLTNVLMFPILQCIFSILFFFIPKIDPKKENIKEFENTFHIFIYAFMSFMTLLQLQVFLWNTGTKISMNTVMPILMGLLFIVVAQLVSKAKQNYTIGIRTPWTLSSEKVWNKTHKLGGKLFLICGILSIFSFLLPEYTYIVVLASVILSTIIVFAYSYIEYKKESRK